MESQPQNPEFRNNPENFHPCSGRVPVLQRPECCQSYTDLKLQYHTLFNLLEQSALFV